MMIRRTPTLVALIALVSILPVTLPVAGQPLERVDPAPGGMEVAPGRSLDEKAAFIAQYDDGSADSFYRASTATLEIAMLFENVGGPDVTLGSVDFCWRQSGSDPKIRYEVVLWAADGPGGSPGTELATFAAVAEGVTSSASFDSTSMGYPLTETDVYIGVRWNPVVDPDFFVCIDDDGLGGGPAQPVYRRFDESSSWFDLVDFIPDYKALMIRAFLATPGVVAESLFVPFYLVDTTGPGTTTLFAVRDLTGAGASVNVEYLEVDGTIQRDDTINLGPFETRTVNIRDVPGLTVDGDGFARGSVRLTTAGNPDRTPVLGGDYFQVDTVNDFATGNRLPRQFEMCSRSSIRMLDFGSPTRLTIFIANPRGDIPGVDPPSFTVQAYDEPGNPVGVPVEYHTVDNAVEVNASDFSAERFGTLDFDFSNGGGGIVYAEYRAEGRFSIGLTGQCHSAP